MYVHPLTNINDATFAAGATIDGTEAIIAPTVRLSRNRYME